MTRSLARLALVLAVAASPANAHDFFLMPETFAPGASAAKVAATIGSAFPTPEIAVTADRVATLAAHAAGAAPRVAVTGAKAKTLELALDALPEGPTVVGAALRARDVEYGEDRIDLILGEYRVSDAARAAVAALPRPRTLKVDSRRFAKTILCRTRCDGLASVRPHGFELEFVPVARDRFRLVEAGAPLGNYPIAVATRDGTRRELATDARGEVALPPDAAGATMLFAATMATPARTDARFVLRLTSLTINRDRASETSTGAIE